MKTNDKIFGTLGVAALAIPAIFGGIPIDTYSEYQYIAKLDPVIVETTIEGDLLEYTDRCGMAHIGNGFAITAAHCVDNDKYSSLLRNSSFEIPGKAIIPNSYDFPRNDISIINDAFPKNWPKIDWITKDLYYEYVLKPFSEGKVVKINSFGAGTTKLDQNGNPTNVSKEIKMIETVIVAATEETFSVKDPLEKGGVCVGDSGNIASIDINGKPYVLGVVSNLRPDDQGKICNTSGFSTNYIAAVRHTNWIKYVKSYCFNNDECVREKYL